MRNILQNNKQIINRHVNADTKFNFVTNEEVRSLAQCAKECESNFNEILRLYFGVREEDISQKEWNILCVLFDGDVNALTKWLSEHENL